MLRQSAPPVSAFRESSTLGSVGLVDAQLLLGQAVRARIAAWDAPFIDDREEAAGEVGLMLQEVVRQCMPEAIPPHAALDGVMELSARLDGNARIRLIGAFYVLMGSQNLMLPVDADLAVGASSTIRVADEPSLFEMPTSAKQFERRMRDVERRHRVAIDLP